MKSNRFFATLIILFLFVLTIHAQEERPKIGLVLSGGGARGLAHIGTLKLIDSLHIPIDYIAGTSMGGIIGGLYAAGYTGNEIERIALSIDWTEMLSDEPPRIIVPYLQKKDDGKFLVELGIEGITPVIPSGLIAGQNISLKFADLTSGVGSIQNFDELPIPYRCVAIDLITGKEVVLKEGSLARAMRATMTIPTVFSPVSWGDSLLIDGGVLNNFPADVMKEMGADIIIGVNVGSQLKTREQLQSLVNVIEQTMVLTDYAKQKENFELCDLMIQPDLEGFTLADFEPEKVREIIKRGIEAAEENKLQLVEVRDKYVVESSEVIEIDSLIKYPPKINSIILGSGTLYTLEYLYELIGHKPNDTLNVVKLMDRISDLKASGLFKDIKYDVQQVSPGNVNFLVRLIEKERPVIHGVTIVGNESLHFDFIYDIFGFKPGDTFDKKKINFQIRQMYALGYFEEITYVLKPVRDNYVHLQLTVKEKPVRRLRIGYRYDDRYKFIGLIGLQTTNFPFTGFRAEGLIQFAGLLKLDYIAMYPSRTLSLPIYPYIRLSYKDVPIDIFDFESGNRIAEYNYKSWLFGGGFGHLIENVGEIKFEYDHEYLNIDPNSAGLDPAFFPSWKDNLRLLKASFCADALDDPILPRFGIKINITYDASLKSLNSALDYNQYEITAKAVFTFARKHTFTVGGYYTDFSGDLPTYKYVTKGGPDSFVGMKINQIEAHNLGYIRVDYRYEFKKDIYFELIGNIANYKFKGVQGGEKFENPLLGYGIGIKLMSIVGPFEIMFSRGSRGVQNWKMLRTQIYFSAGFAF